MSPDIHHGCIEFFVAIDRFCTWDVMLFAKLTSLVSILMLLGRNSGLPLPAGKQTGCYMRMRGVCMCPAQRIDNICFWRFKEIREVVGD